MKNKKLLFKHLLSLAGLLVFVLLAVGSIDDDSSKAKDPKENKKEEIQPIQTKELSDDYLGNYHGIQESYFVKNQYGDDMMFDGNKAPVPSHDFKFLLKKDNVASLQLTNLEDNQRDYLDGSYKIINDESDVIKVEISLRHSYYGPSTYILEINKSDKKGNCIGSKSEPVINISKIN